MKNQKREERRGGEGRVGFLRGKRGLFARAEWDRAVDGVLQDDGGGQCEDLRLTAV